MIKYTIRDMKVAVFDKDILGDQNFCLKLNKDSIACFMREDEAILLAHTILKAADEYFEHPENATGKDVIPEEKKTNKITCDECKYGIDVDQYGRIKLCDNPNLKTFGKNVKYAYDFSCGYGVMWNEAEDK